MFDIGFAELVIIGIVGLLVIGPERLPDAIRTGSAWLSRIKRGFNDIKQEVKQELHNDGVLRDIQKTVGTIHEEAEKLDSDLRSVANDLNPSEEHNTSAGKPNE